MNGKGDLATLFVQIITPDSYPFSSTRIAVKWSAKSFLNSSTLGVSGIMLYFGGLSSAISFISTILSEKYAIAVN